MYPSFLLDLEHSMWITYVCTKIIAVKFLFRIKRLKLNNLEGIMDGRNAIVHLVYFLP